MKNVFKRTLSSLLALLMVFGLFSVTAADVYAKDSTGYTPTMTMTQLQSGSADAVSGGVYSISTKEELVSFASYVNAGRATEGATFYLTKDIKLSKDTVYGPIGRTSATAFRGVFDGCGYAVLNLTNASAGNGYALFGYVSGANALIKNLGVEGEITGGTGVAGIVCILNTGAVENCWSAVDVSGSSYVGGIAAEVAGGRISNSLSYGYVKGGSKTGAIAGIAGSGAVIDFSYYVYYTADEAVGLAEKSTVNVYRFAGGNTEALAETTITVGKARTNDMIELLNAWIEQKNAFETYRSWEFDTSASATSRTGGNYPMLTYPGYTKAPDSSYVGTATMTALYSSGKSGEVGGYYSISSAQELAYLRDYTNAGYLTEGLTFYQTADINMASITVMTSDQMWIPIGKTEKLAFKGVYDGQGYVIADNYINAGSDQGLFAFVDGTGAEIKNVAATGSISGNDNIGGIVGNLINGSVTNCWFAGSINASDRVGGIVGKAEAGVIANCVDFASITAKSKLGGIVGKAKSGVTVQYCYYPSAVSLPVGDGSPTQTSVVSYSQNGASFTLTKSVSVGTTSGVMLLNVLNAWVNELAVNSSYRAWKLDSTAAGIARIQGEHPTQQYPGDSTGDTRVDEPSIDVDSTNNPYNTVYAETGTMTELYESGKDAIKGGHYSISTAQELKLLAEFVNGGKDTANVVFYLKDDVVIATKGLGNEGDGWQPIGKDYSGVDASTLTNVFRGTFDGCGYTVSGMFMTNEKGDNLGLFGRVRGGTIRNVGVVGAIVGEWNCGGIVGKIDDGLIENCWTAVSIQSESETGGIAGRIDHTTIRNCVSYGGILCYGGETCVGGGIFGDDMGKSTVENCYYLDSAAVAGYNDLKSSSTADILSFSYGFENDNYYCTLERAASIGSVTTLSLLDALNAWVQAQNSGQHSGWYESDVLINDGSGNYPGHYPRLMRPDYSGSENGEYCGDYTATSTMSALYNSRKDGIEGGCYSINSMDDLEALQKYVNEGFKTKDIIFFMTRDIDMSGRYSASSGMSWTPIGNSSEQFKGIFDGQGYTVKYLYINNTADDQGLFGHAGNGAIIKNLGICGVVKAGTNAGGIVGDFNFATLANCWSSCEVTATGNNAGGLVGGANMGTIVNCANYGAVVNSAQYGAIAGYAFGTTMKYCYYLYGSCQQPYGEASTPVVSGVQYFNGTSAACILHEKVDVEGTVTRNALSALKLYVDAHTETNYCYWTTGNTAEYLEMGVADFPVLISASGTLGGNDLKTVQAYYNGEEFYSVAKAVNTANDSAAGGEVTLATNAILNRNEDITVKENVRIVTGDYSLVVKARINVTSMQQLDGMFIVKEGGSIGLWDARLNDYKLFMYANRGTDASCNSEIYGAESLTFFSYPIEGGSASAYNLTLRSGEFIVNSTLDSGNPHKIPAGSTITIESHATLNVSSNSRIRTTGGAEIFNRGTVKIGNATLVRNGGERMKGVFEDTDNTVSLPYIYKDGYTLRGWSDGENLYPAGSTVTVETATTLTAQWKLGDSTDPYPGDDAYSDNDDPAYNIPISIIQTKGGKISPESLMAAKGENLTFNVKNELGYYIKNVLVDAESVTLDDTNNYEFISISRAHDMVALFAQTTNSAYYSWVSPFRDVKPTDWFYNNVRYCASANLFNGTSSTTFEPDTALTREMFVTVLWRLSGEPTVPGNGSGFNDVPRNSYAYEAIRWGNYYGIVKGIGGGSFGYGAEVTREQLVTFMFRYAKNYAGDDVSLYDTTNILGYSDVLKISQGMSQPFQWAIGAGIVTGATSTTLDPQGTASRAQVAAILSRYCNKFVNTVPVFG